ncbi:uncharacterized protein LOC109856396 isoform X2 [Pseudomyrmex gracilis]|uniref:uncharacterized protein LOC109856396 isoform X2 n=1 Tax=Pseudomyrmex gracilis TaxID=219809 RepID=UPI000994CD32|nr:uncharacterized protein LOC109856396 isoform X2 [Pseudomyrmex gracilis]
MLRQKGLLLSTCLLACTASLTLALPPGATWSSSSSPVYSRALGPPSGIDTISVPYVPKSPFFPKFVDPKMFISKKTDMLSNLFGGLGPVQTTVTDTKPIVPYGSSGSSLDSAETANLLYSTKRDAPPASGEAIDSSGVSKRGMLGPFPKFGPMGPKFGPTSPFSSSFSPFSSPDAIQTPYFRKKRSVESLFSTDDNSVSGPHVIESMSATKADSAPKEYLPGMFGPGGPFGGPFGPAVDPSMFIGKKSTFLDSLFKNLATSTPATTTEEPMSTIVPASFWLPSSVIPGPGEYTSKVSDFLDKLFDSLKLNATSDASDGAKFMRSLKPEELSVDKRSLDDASSVVAAKDAIVDAIMSELGDLKGDMIATLNDLIAYEKASAVAAAASKKPFKPSPFSGFPFAKPTLDPTLPFKQRMTVLSQVFDMLTDLQKNITTAAKSATSNNVDASNNPELPNAPLAGASSINNTLLSAILKKLSAIDTATSASYPSDFIKENPIASRALSKEPTSIWVSYPENPLSRAKRQADLLPFLGYENDDRQRDHRPYTRGVKMQMHQGYQSLPAGSVESVQAGGGSTPGHQGGGIKLLIQMPKLPNSQAPGLDLTET